MSAGLVVEFFHEHHFTAYQALPMMEQGEDGWWRLPEGGELVPFLFSLKATKPELRGYWSVPEHWSFDKLGASGSSTGVPSNCPTISWLCW